jgi:hypothetical protein
VLCFAGANCSGASICSLIACGGASEGAPGKCYAANVHIYKPLKLLVLASVSISWYPSDYVGEKDMYGKEQIAGRLISLGSQDSFGERRGEMGCNCFWRHRASVLMFTQESKP